MPIRWYGTGDTKDPVYLHFSRIVNLTIHFMAFAAINSGLWLFESIKNQLPQLSYFSLIWLTLLVGHLVFVIIKKPSSKIDPLITEE